MCLQVNNNLYFSILNGKMPHKPYNVLNKKSKSDKQPAQCGFLVSNKIYIFILQIKPRLTDKGL